MSVKTKDREWLLDYSNQQADFSKEKTKPKGKDSCQLSQTEGHQLFSNFLFLYFHHHTHQSIILNQKKPFEPVYHQHFSELRHSKNRIVHSTSISM